MSIQQMLLGGSGVTGYNLERSLRFRASASAYLSRTPAGAGNRKTWTLSLWMKRSTAGTDVYLYEGYSSDSNRDLFRFANDTLVYGNATATMLQTTQVFRDPSAWYHFVLVSDTTQATASNRVKLYVNGTQITAFTTSSYPAQNYEGFINSNVLQTFMRGSYGGAYGYQDGYLTEVNFIDGQALTPASFGETNALTGVWQPKAYTGTYGTNGFYLPFTDNSALTTSSNVGLGKDFSGNGNYWTTNNISITSGVTYDSMTDVPTLTSATVANYCVLNPNDKDNSTTTLTNGNLNWSAGAPTYNQVCRGTIAVTSGKWYWEVTPLTNGAWANMGVCDALGTLANASRLAAGGWVYQGTSGNKMNNNSSVAYGATYTNNDVIGVALDMDGNTLTFYKNGVSQGVAYSTGFSGKTIAPLMQDAANDTTAAINFGQRPFAYTPPTGFVALNAFNLPAATVVKGNEVMDATLYTGNATVRSIVNAGEFAPDLVWIKSRSQAYSHRFFDSIRGPELRLFSNTTDVEGTSVGSLTAFNSNGFSLGVDTAGPAGYGVNENGNSYVAWQWSGGGTAVSNTDGSITSQVSANTSSGFSVVTYTGNSAIATVGHGLGVAPSLIIVKSRSQTYNWNVYSSSVGANQFLRLNTTDDVQTSSVIWNNTRPTSSVFSLGNAVGVNESGFSHVAYCFAPIAGYSAFGSYTGNGSADGTFVYLGFRPKFVIVKASSSVTYGVWVIKDTARNTSNVAAANLYANLNVAEDSISSVGIDIVSNGFKLRGTYDGINGSGASYIYMAFAENPFKYSLAR